MPSWTPGHAVLAAVVENQTATCLKVYAEDPARILEDANNEAKISTGGYSTRQLEELVQNAVDAARAGGRQVEVVLTRDALYVANDGAPFDEKGVRAIMASDISSKGEEQVGRFGIGFKSVLAVSDAPRIYSTSVSFGFDRAQAEATLREAGFESRRFPTMRTATILDPALDFEGDAVLRELQEWASTIVVLPLRDAEAHRLLSVRLDLFRNEFVLFSPHVTRVGLRNEDQFPARDVVALRGLALSAEERGLVLQRQPPRRRTLSVEEVGAGVFRLQVNDEATDWAVARTTHVPSPAARVEGSYSAGRDVVEVAYAVCLTRSAYEMGQFWSYFPTGDLTTLSGIVNAPWKLSDDRKHLLRGAFNEELLTRVLPPLIVRAFRAFQGTDRIAAVLDAMPARGNEPRSDADDIINVPVINHLRREPSLPDGTGRLRVATKLQWLGGDTLGRNSPVSVAWLERWRDAGGHADRWVHPMVYTNPERRAKVARLMKAADSAPDSHPASIEAWLEDVVEKGAVDECAKAIDLAAWVLDQSGRLTDLEAGRQLASGVSRAKIVRLDTGVLKAATKGRVFVKVEGEDRTGVDFVDPELVAVPGVKEGLSRLGVVLMDRTGRLRELLTRALTAAALKEPGSVWPQIWEILREIPHGTALSLLRQDLNCTDARDLTLRTRVKTAAGRWVPPGMAFLAGDIVPVDGSRDRDFLIDPRFHRDDAELLREIGAVEAPTARYEEVSREQWYLSYIDAMKEHFIADQQGARPDPDYVLVEGPPPLWPMQILTEMSPEARAAATARIIAQGIPAGRTVRHRSNASYGQKKVISPEAWFIRRYGLLRTSFGLMKPKHVLVASESVPTDSLPAYETSSHVARTLRLQDDPAKVTADDWSLYKSIADTWTRDDSDDRRRAAFYVWTADSITPEAIMVRVGSRRQLVEPKNVGVTDDDDVYAAMLEAQVPALRVAEAEDVDIYVQNWSMPLGKDLLQEEIVVETSGEAEFLTDLFPPLRLRLAPEDQDLRLQPCARLERMIATPQGQKAQSIAARREGTTILTTATSREGQLQQVSHVLSLGMSSRDVAQVFDQMAQTVANKLRVAIKKATDDDERLLMAVGLDALRRIVPAQALEALENRPEETTPQEIAALARAVHGVGILKQLRTALDAARLDPPREWSGRRPTRQWIASLGFPAEWAGFPGSSRPAVEVIDGPATLGELHDYQQHVTRNIAAMLRGVGSDRGMVSLPTGAGKTRVTVEALVNEINATKIDTDRPLVWIAQTDELCEQAAETWTYVWRAIGSSVPMRLGRLWGGNHVPEEPGAFQLVIATIDTLDERSKGGGDEYDWLKDPSVVVIDEAHTSIAPTYTKVLEWMGRGGRGRDSAADPKPLIGLTATPFRGTSTEETERLVRRYDGNRLDRGAFRNADDPYGELQDMGVLAQVRHQVIDGTDVELTDVDLAEIEKMRRLPSAVNTRLGADLARTERIVDAIADLPGDWTILTFAPSVENSRVIAALLSHRGIPAVSISADTEPAARRHYVEEFKAGRIRVLTNYNVLTQGFDAPKVQAVFVARPTFSPNVYQQMIGRGLRGPKNGGSEEVLIINVRDNFQKYGELLAFNEFEYLWNRR
ncbi:MAG: DEAD/DEAH box helicase family protein [Promicromonosporaceae bacterium]|nr:DEAD/DEAH box helicase family protein [Promicromonosporaceae bacterium]